MSFINNKKEKNLFGLPVSPSKVVFSVPEPFNDVLITGTPVLSEWNKHIL
jgi:hypothetical protein